MNAKELLKEDIAIERKLVEAAWRLLRRRKEELRGSEEELRGLEERNDG